MVNTRNKIKYNKKGWIRLVEVFIAILLLTGVLLIIFTRNSSEKENFQIETAKKELAMLRDIELNNTLRAEILGIGSSNLPVEWSEFNSQAPNLKSRIIYLTPKNLECQAKICLIDEICVMDELSNGDIYVEGVVISANATVYSPRQLKLFCIKKVT